MVLVITGGVVFSLCSITKRQQVINGVNYKCLPYPLSK